MLTEHFVVNFSFSFPFESHVPTPHVVYMDHSRDRKTQQDLFEEQMRVMGSNAGKLSLDNINSMTHLWASVRETLRLRPPLLTLMRRHVPGWHKSNALSGLGVYRR